MVKVSDNVRYADEQGTDHRALVTAVHSADCVSLVYVNSDGSVVTRTNVLHYRNRVSPGELVRRNRAGQVVSSGIHPIREAGEFWIE